MHGRVDHVERLTPHLLRVVLAVEGFVDCGRADSYVNAQFPPAGAPYAVPFDEQAVRDLPREQQPAARRYTVRSWDADRGLLAIDFVVHGDEGIAGPWAQNAQPGDLLQMKGPAGGYDPDPEADWVLLVGDESALPAIAVCAERAAPDQPVVAVVVVDGPEDELPLESPGDLAVVWVHRGSESIVDAVAGVVLPAGRGSAFVHGEAEETRAVRKHLMRNEVVAPEDLSCSPYWREGMTDEKWRSVKSAWVKEMEND